MNPYRNTYRHIYFDNFFASIELLIDLLNQGLYGCGTVRTNRKGFPKTLQTLAKEGLGERGRSKKFQHGNVTATVWQDNKPVPVVATNADLTITTEVHRKNKDGSRAVVQCPELYNRYMGGVNRNDQLLPCSPKVSKVLQIYFLVSVWRFCDQQLHLVSSVRRQSRQMYF